MTRFRVFYLRLSTVLAFAAAFGFSANPKRCVAAESSGLRDIGLVLSGGGAKGAYEVGVWHALVDLGLTDRIAAISGTSVGAINAAAFASGLPPNKIEKIWIERLTGIFTISDIWIQEHFGEWLLSAQADDSKGKWKTTTGTALQGAMSLAKLRFGSGPLEGALDPIPLEVAITSSIPSEWPANSPTVFASAVARNGAAGPSLEVFRLNDTDFSNRVEMLCASAAIPFAYPARRIGKRYYLDGGTRIPGFPGRLQNPSPLFSVSQVKTIIAVYLNNLEHLSPKDMIEGPSRSSGVRLIEIFPSENIGGGITGWQGVFDASPETAKHLIELGRRDAERKLREEGLIE